MIKMWGLSTEQLVVGALIAGLGVVFLTTWLIDMVKHSDEYDTPPTRVLITWTGKIKTWH